MDQYHNSPASLDLSSTRPYQHLTKLQSRQLQLWWCVQEPHWWPQQINKSTRMWNFPMRCDGVTFPKRLLIFFFFGWCVSCFIFFRIYWKWQIFELWVASGPTYYLPRPGTATKGSFVGCTCWVYKINDTKNSYFQAEILPPWDVNSTRDAMMQPNPLQGAERTWLTLHEPLIASG